MRFPRFLNQNGRIGFVAPSFGCNIEPYHTSFNHALEVFRAAGFETVLGPNCYAGEGIGISNTPEKCAEELMEYYTTDKSDVLLACGGGELMCEILPHLDLKALKTAAPKWFMGYSDITNMTFLQATIFDTAAIYGPCASTFGMEPWHPSVKDAFRMLCGESPITKDSYNGYFAGLCTEAVNGLSPITVIPYPYWEKESLKSEETPLMPYQTTEPSTVRIYMPDKEPVLLPMAEIYEKAESYVRTENGVQEQPEPLASVSGRLIGGCVDCLVNLLGTEFDHVADFTERYEKDGFIWFLEACDLNVMAIRRAFWQMEHAGWFRNVKGFLIGRPLCHGEESMGLNQYHAVLDILRHYEVPVFMDMDIGHIAPMHPLICGSYARVVANDRGVGINMYTC